MGSRLQFTMADAPQETETLPEGPLPSYMIGNFQLSTSENFNELMCELGVNWVTRNIANNLYPVQKIRQVGEDIYLDTETTFRSTQTCFKLNTTWQETTADGRYTQTVATLEGNVLKKIQTPDASTGYHTTHEEREFDADGEVMTMRISIPGKPEVTSTRVYKRIEIPDIQ